MDIVSDRASDLTAPPRPDPAHAIPALTHLNRLEAESIRIISKAAEREGLYQRARRGEIQHFAGIRSVYEPLLAPELVIDTCKVTAEQRADIIVARLLDA